MSESEAVSEELLERISKEFVSWCECDGCNKYRAYCKAHGIVPGSKMVN